MQWINNELMLNANMVKFKEMYYRSIHVKSHLLVQCSHYGAIKRHSVIMFALTDSIHSMHTQ